MGFFADVGPLTVFVSHQVCSILDDCLSQHELMHPSSSSIQTWNLILPRTRLHLRQTTRYELPPLAFTHFYSPLQIIEKNTKVRLKIVGTRVDATEIVRLSFICYLTPYWTRSEVCYWHHQGRPPGSDWVDCNLWASLVSSLHFVRLFCYLSSRIIHCSHCLLFERVSQPPEGKSCRPRKTP